MGKVPLAAEEEIIFSELVVGTLLTGGRGGDTAFLIILGDLLVFLI